MTASAKLLRTYAATHVELRRDVAAKPKTFQERQLHLRVREYLEFALPKDAFVFHPTNEARRTPREGAMMKRLGLVPGVPDLIVFHLGRAYGIELKSDVGRLTPSQRTCHAALERAGVPTAVCRSIAEVETALRTFAIPNRTRIAA